MATTKFRFATGVLAGGLLLGGLTACSGSVRSGGPSAGAGTSGPSVGASASASIGDVGASGSAGAVDCSGTTCSVTLDTGDNQATVLGQTVSLGKVENGEATLGVAGHDVTCRQGDSVSAGPLKLTCSTVTADSVTVSAKLG